VITERDGKTQPQDSLSLQTSKEKKQKAMTRVDYEKVLNHLLSLKII